MAQGNFARRRGTGLRRDWREAPDERSPSRRGRPGAEQHALALAAAGLVTVVAAAALIPQVKLPSLPDSSRLSVTRTLYPRLSSVPTPPPSATPSLPTEPRGTVEAPASPGTAEPVTIREIKPVVPEGIAESGAAANRKASTAEAAPGTSGKATQRVVPRKPKVVQRSSGERSRDTQPRKSTRTRKVRLAQANSVRRAPSRFVEPSRKRRVVRKSAPATVARNETRASSTREERVVRGATTTAGWVGSTDSREEAFLREWRKFKTREERLQEQQRKRVSEQLIVEPLD